MSRSARARPIAVHLVWGLALLARSAKRGRVVLERGELRLLRVLGVRHLAQGLVLTRLHGRRALLISAGADAIHGGSMAAAALLSARLRPLVLPSLAVSLLLCRQTVRATPAGAARRRSEGKPRRRRGAGAAERPVLSGA
jgi:hypothetical protein